MRKVLLTMVVLLFGGAYAIAQKAEVSAGYNYLHIDAGAGRTDNSLTEGFYVDGTYYLLKSAVGATADFSYNTKTFAAGDFGLTSVDAHAYGFHVGPRVKAHIGRAEPFGHILFGFTHLSATPAGGTNLNDNAFSLKMGGGLDIGITHHFAFRLGEFNYWMTKFGVTSPVNLNGSGQQNNFTISTGIVIR